MTDKLIKLTGETTVVGRSVMVHADHDDLGKGNNSEPGTNGKTSLATGNAGARLTNVESSSEIDLFFYFNQLYHYCHNVVRL